MLSIRNITISYPPRHSAQCPSFSDHYSFFEAMSDIIKYFPTQMEQGQETLLKALSDSSITQMNAVAVTVWVGYDILLTTSEEINTMWSRRFVSPPSLMYFITRYFSFSFLVYNAFTTIYSDNTVATCLAWGILEAMSVQIVALLVNGLLAFRVYAFYHGNVKMKWVILGLWVSETIIEVTMVVLAKIETGEPIPPPSYLPMSGCISDAAETPFSTITSWITNTLYSVICFGLLAYRFITVYFEGHLTSVIAEMFIRDGAMLFIMLCGSNIVNIILLYAAPKSPLILMGFSWFIGAGSISASRTILSLRGGRNNSKRSITEYELTQGHTITKSSRRHDVIDSSTNGYGPQDSYHPITLGAEHEMEMTHFIRFRLEDAKAQQV
ncbi:hypothetical protein BDY19DRAFT_598031 [Irpex rosettiformis]|uniref:Uncharacterized protein n=1 Tax=Irpex rosettiformis TaxID=378272 RepID=A0ACB8UDI1_9APHY|nr:hypothetical protein BDY19DRAFT_598031 [Irpex rosettiformis]